MPDLKAWEAGLADTQREAQNLTVMALRPDNSPEEAELLRNAERSARAEVRLRKKHLAYLRKRQADQKSG